MATNAVAIKLPEFWESSAAAWFSTVEAQFEIRKITDDKTQYYYVVAALGSSVASRLVGLLTDPPEENKYATLKALLLKTFELSTAEREGRLFAIQGLGDSKPSVLMEKMLNLLGREKPCFLFMELFLRNMPTRVQVALANTTITEPRALAEEADRFFLATQRPSPDLLAPTISAPPPVYRTAARDNSMPLTSVEQRRVSAFTTPGSAPKLNSAVPLQLQSSGKREGRRSVVALSAGDSSRLLFIRDTISNRRFLCDTGAQRSVIPTSEMDIMSREHGPQLATADGSPIRSYGTFTSFACTRGEAVYSGLSSLLSEEDQYLRLLAEFPDLTQPTFSAPTVKHGVEHHIDTKGPPVYARARRLDPAKLAVAKAEFAHMEQVGIIRSSDSPWASPLHIIAKPGGGWRTCGDYRRLNDTTTPDRYPVPHIQDFSAHLSDDILIASATEEEHLSHLRVLFTRLSQHGLIVNPAKCLFGRGTIEFLGHRVTCEGAVPLPSKVEAVAAFPRPLTARSLREFIGMVTFYHRFIPRAAHTLRPLYEALKGKSPNQAIEWTAEQEGAFKDTKAALAQAAMLAHPSHTAPIAITTPFPSGGSTT
ncbi:hypothetical protein AAFF_G00409340 [Aldrovandia affinis]|uniref:ribonuclease H n=1 Tax=Aldrovandia affinis TaxID=143900 RepID=A0AAD7WJV7_9TELE|nr:hypothetical protein AAFF_G00409340 [Aldrovandia affinis]